MRSVGATAALLALTLAAACVGDTGPPFAVAELDFRSYTPPPIYSVWWQDVRECSGWEGELDDLKFHRVFDPEYPDGHNFRCFEQDRRCQGAFVRPNRIYIAKALVENEWIVKHEMLHALGESGHSSTTRGCTS